MSKRRRLFIVAAVSALCIVLLVALANKLGDRTGPTAIQKMDTKALDHQIRTALPLGTPLAVVQSYLNQPGIHPSFDQSIRTEFAVIRNVRGSNAIIRRDFGFDFAFDDNMKLKSITSKEELTGP